MRQLPLLAALSGCYQPPITTVPVQQLSATPSGDQVVFDSTGQFLALSHHAHGPSITVQSLSDQNAFTRSFEDEFALYDMAWSPDGQQIAVLGDDSLVRMTPGLATLKTHSLDLGHHGSALAWDPLGVGIVVLPANEPTVIWLDLQANRSTPLALPTSATAVDFGPDGQVLGLSLLDGDWLVLSRSELTGGA